MDIKNNIESNNLSNIRLEALFDNLLEGILIEDQNRKILTVNNKFIEYFCSGLSPSLIIGQDCGEMAESTKYHFRNSDEFLKRLNNILTEKRLVLKEEIETTDGKIYHRDYIPIHHNEIYMGNLWKYREITDEKETIRRFQDSEKELKDTNTFKDKLFSIIAHDLRGPLASLKGVVDLINEGDISLDNSRDVFFSLGKQLDYTFQLLNNLLVWSSHQLKKREFFPQKIILTEKIKTILSALEPLSQSKNISITNEVDHDCIIFFDRETLSIVMRNLISNAVKYTPKSGNIRIFVENLLNGINIHIMDSGIGISPEDKKKLFGYSSANSKPGTNKEKGTGIGLLLCKELMELNQGAITVQSEVGIGSDFVLFIPNP